MEQVFDGGGDDDGKGKDEDDCNDHFQSPPLSRSNNNDNNAPLSNDNNNDDNASMPITEQPIFAGVVDETGTMHNVTLPAICVQTEGKRILYLRSFFPMSENLLETVTVEDVLIMACTNPVLDVDPSSFMLVHAVNPYKWADSWVIPHNRPVCMRFTLVKRSSEPHRDWEYDQDYLRELTNDILERSRVTTYSPPRPSSDKDRPVNYVTYFKDGKIHHEQGSLPETYKGTNMRLQAMEEELDRIDSVEKVVELNFANRIGIKELLKMEDDFLGDSMDKEKSVIRLVARRLKEGKQGRLVIDFTVSDTWGEATWEEDYF